MASEDRILIIDDEEVVLDSCTQILRASGYQIATASNGESGLRSIDEFRPDLVYVDLKMPGLSGLDVIKAVRESDPSLVIIVITGFATVSSAIEAMKIGAYDFLPKPFTPDEFRMITRRGLETRHLMLETIALKSEREALRENFAAIVSHELKAPLGAVQQNLFVLADELAGVLSREQKARLDRIQNRISALTQIILTWLRVLSVDMTKLRDTFRRVLIQDVVAKAVDNLTPTASRKEVEIVTVVEGVSAAVSGDEGTLVEALTNILGNAVKYSRPSSRVILTTRQSGPEVLISVADTGTGISKEDLPHIFGDFYRGKANHTAETGSGIGLAVARRIVEAHRGSIAVESEPGTGSTFVIQLPGIGELEPA
ncbi:MAG TPA: hybrid sensor histidine kinase/response regulator [Anaerolineales bacterium]|nr:hybrid sensor histidine kinase/response regulator [Anaerolineales bacterium]